MKKKLTVITCPNCGKEYLPAEIFVPKMFFGNPEVISRDCDEKIISFSGSSMDLTESYRCDSCDKEFNVTAKVSFETSLNSELDFDTDYESTFGTKLKLNEF